MELSEKDRDDAREVLGRGWLTIDQVTSVKDAVKTTGMSFRDAARAKGFLSPSQVEQIGNAPPPKALPTRPSSFYPFLLLTTVSMIMASGIYLYTWYEKRENRQEKETRELRRRADETAQASASRLSESFRKQKEKQRLDFVLQARKELEEGKRILGEDPDAPITSFLKNATRSYSQALQISLDAELLEERAGAYEFWGALPEAIADLEHAARLAPGKADDYRKRITALQAKLPTGLQKQ